MAAARDRRAADVLAAAVQELAGVGDGGADSFVCASRRALAGLLPRGDLLRGVADVGAARFSRRLLFADPHDRFGIWVLTWPPGCRTPIHNHHCACTFGVYRGRIDEIIYAEGPDREAVVESRRFVRAAGFVGGERPQAGYVHEMLNTGSDPAVSVHIYAYRPDARPDSIERCFVRRSPGEEHP